MHAFRCLPTNPVLSGRDFHPLELIEEIVMERLRPAPRANMLADAVEQVRGHPGVSTGSVKPLGRGDPDGLRDPAEAVACVARKHPPRQKQRAKRANLPRCGNPCRVACLPRVLNRLTRP